MRLVEFEHRAHWFPPSAPVARSCFALDHDTQHGKLIFIGESGVDYDVVEILRELEEAASKLEFEKAALLRDQIMELKKTTGGDKEAPTMSSKPIRAAYSRPKRARKASSGSKR